MRRRVKTSEEICSSLCYTVPDMPYSPLIFAAIGVAIAQPAAIELPVSPCPGWKVGPQETVKPTGVFEYMNGAGELYLAYGFRDIYVRVYEKPGQPRITCEAYRMPTSADAFGLFSQDRTGRSLKIGQGAVYASGLLIAWQGKWFVRILADRETPEAKRCVSELAKQVVKLCGPPGKPPDALAWLPKAGLDPRSVHFFHTQNLLNSFHFVASENLLGLSSRTDVVMGTYSSKAGKSLALAVGYPKAADAEAAWARFRKVYVAGLKPDAEYSASRLGNGKWAAGVAKGRKVCIVLESPTRDEAKRLAAAIGVAD